jgi:hypothetical protein
MVHAHVCNNFTFREADCAKALKLFKKTEQLVKNPFSRVLVENVVVSLKKGTVCKKF